MVSLARDIEKENLEAHVELCAERYKRLEEKFDQLETRLGGLAGEVSAIKAAFTRDNKIILKTIIATAGTVVVALISTAAAILSSL